MTKVPASPLVLKTLLETVDAYIIHFGDFSLQRMSSYYYHSFIKPSVLVRMAAIYQLIRDHEDVSFILSVCRVAPQPVIISGWQQQNASHPSFSTPLATLQIFPSSMNSRQSSFPASAFLPSSTLSSPYPRFPSLMDFSPSTRLQTLQNLQLSSANTISESVSEPRFSSAVQVFSSLLVSSDAPTLGVFSSTSNLSSPSSASSALGLAFSHNDSSLPIPPPFQDLGTFSAINDYPPYLLDTESSAINAEPSSSSESIFTTASQDDMLIEPQEVNMASPSSSALLYSPEMNTCDQQDKASATATPTLAVASHVTSDIKLGPQPTPYAGTITALPEDSLSKLFSRQNSSSPPLFSPGQASVSPTTVPDPAFTAGLIDTQDTVNSRPATPSISTTLCNVNGSPSISGDLLLPAQLPSPLSSPTRHLHIPMSPIPASPHSPISKYTGRLPNTTFRDTTTSSTSQPAMHQRAFSTTFSPNLPFSQSQNKRKHAVLLEQPSELSPSYVITATRSQQATKLPIGLGLGLDPSQRARKKVKTSTGERTVDKENQMRLDGGMNL